MWADTLLAAERAHLLRLAVWAAGSILVGTAIIAALRLKGRASPLMLHFGVQSAAWGVVDLLIAWAANGSLALRNLGSARQLERVLWFNAGLDGGYLAVGLCLAICGWVMGRRLGLVGAGVGVVVQGAALLVLDLILAGQLATMV